MAKIPRFNASDINIAQGSGAGSVSGASPEGEALESLGAGISSAARGISKYVRAKEAVDNNIFEKGAKAQSARDAQEAENLALNSDKLKPDHSNLVDLFDEHMGKFEEGFSKDIDNESHAQAASSHYSSAGTKRRDNLFNKQRLQHANFSAEKVDTIVSTQSDIISDNPEMFDFVSADTDELIEDNRMIFGNQTDDYKKKAVKSHAITAVNSWIKSEDYDQAEKFIEDSGQFSDVAAVGQPSEVEKMLAMVENKKLVKINSDLRDMNLEDRESKKELANQKAMTREALRQGAVAATTEEERNTVVESIDEEWALGNIDNTERNALMKYLEGDEDVDDDRQVAELTRIINLDETKDIGQLERMVTRAMSRGDLKPSSASSLYKQIKTRSRSSKDPVMKRKMASGKKILETIFYTDPWQMDNQVAITRAAALTYYNDLVSKGSDPIDAAYESSRVYGASVDQLPSVTGVPSNIDQDTLEGITATGRYLNRQFNGDVSNTEFKEKLKILKIRYNFLKRTKTLQVDKKVKKEIEGQ